MSNQMIKGTGFKTVRRSLLALGERTAGIRVVLVIVCALSASACTTDLQIYADASFKARPIEGAKVVVVGDPTARETARTWLQDRGLIVLDNSELQRFQESCSGCAEQVISVQSSRLAKPDRIVVFVQGRSAQTDEEMWNGTAWKAFPEALFGEEAQANISLLTCHALATVWRYRPAGHSINTSLDLCAIHR